MDIEITQIEAGHIKPRWLAERADIDIIVPPEARITTPITVLHLNGKLDGSGYRTLIEQVQSVVEEGTSHLIIDMSGIAGMSTAGLTALYVSGTLLDGNPPEDLDGYGVINEMRYAIDEGKVFANMCLVASNEKVTQTLEATGIADIVHILPTIDDAIDSFPDL